MIVRMLSLVSGTWFGTHDGNWNGESRGTERADGQMQRRSVRKSEWREANGPPRPEMTPF